MKTLRTLAAALPFIMLAPSVMANADALDLTFDLGSAKQKGDRFSDTDSSVGLKLGYELTSNWSLSLSYTDFGEAQMPSGTLITENGELFDFHMFIKTKGLGLSAQYLTAPLLGGWSLGGRLGLMHVDSKISSYAPGYQDGLLNSTKDSASTLTFGTLASYALTEQLKLVISADYMAPEIQIYGNSSEDIKTTRFAVGLNYHF